MMIRANEVGYEHTISSVSHLDTHVGVLGRGSRVQYYYDRSFTWDCVVVAHNRLGSLVMG